MSGFQGWVCQLCRFEGTGPLEPHVKSKTHLEAALEIAERACDHLGSELSEARQRALRLHAELAAISRPQEVA